MPYLFYVSQKLATKNKLEKAIQEYLSEQNRKLLANAEKAKLFREVILNHIKHLCEQHPKCKPIVPNWYNHDGSLRDYSDFYLHNVNVVSACLLQSKE